MTAHRADTPENRSGTQRELAWQPRESMNLLNHDLARIDGAAKVTGTALYTHDIRLPNMLYARILCCPYPVAKPTLALDAARVVPGVRVALEWTSMRRPDGFTTYLGQPIAAVAAVTLEAAEDGLRALAASYELGSWVVDEEQAIAADAPQLTDQGNVRFPDTQGDQAAASAALATCDFKTEAVYSLPVQAHACLEPHGVVVDYRGGEEATIYASTQSLHLVRDRAAEALELPKTKVTSIVQHMGGGFGSKLQGLDLPGLIACSLAKITQVPVHLMLDRGQEFVMAGNRSGTRQLLRGGATKDGRFRALEAYVYRFPGIGGEGAHPKFPYIYDVESCFFQGQTIVTNTDASRAMRAPGHPQASFAIESMMDELAYGIGMDPLSFRKKNLTDPVYHRQLDRVAAEIGWAEHPNRTAPPDPLPARSFGIGFAVSIWGTTGLNGSNVDVKIESDGSVTASVGSQDLGTGTRTYVAAIVADELGLGLGQVEARIGDSRYGESLPSGGSRTVPSLAPAVKHAAHLARRSILDRVAPMIGAAVEELVLDKGLIFVRDEPERRLSWLEACATLSAEGLTTRGTFQAQLAGKGVHGAQAAKVTVDRFTGEVRVLKMVCVQDCGLVLNRLATRSQINGGMIQAMSYGLWEEREIDPDLGLLLNGSFEDYKIAGCKDVPELVAILDDEDTRSEVCGVGEPPVIPGQSAIANAIYNACGVRLRQLPLSRDKLVVALAELG